MLVLTRKLDESIQISDNIKITILRIKGNTVRIGIEAPRDVRVVRTELNAVDAQPASQSASALLGKTISQVADALGVSAQSISANGVSTSNNGGCESTVTAIVDSPTIAGPRLFVGTVSEDGQSADLRADVACVEVQSGRFELNSLLPKDQGAPLRAFLRAGQGFTAV